MKIAEYCAYDGLGLAELIRRREVSAREASEAALLCIEKLNPHLNAVIEVFADRVVDADYQPPAHAPFGGVPLLIKDFPTEQGTNAQAGSRLAAGFRADHDSALMVRLRRAGLLTLGRTTTSEFGLLALTASLACGITRNPWDPSLSTAGSSGGSAAAVAAGIVPIASAGDGGGSIRNPASFCGLVGLKPSRGRISLGPDGGNPYSGMVTGFALTRSVRDCAALLDATSGYELGDPFKLSSNITTFKSDIALPPSRLRIALTTRAWSGMPVSEEVYQAVTTTARVLEGEGHTIIEASPHFDYALFLKAQMDLWAAHTTAAINAIALATRRTPSTRNLEPATLALYEAGRNLSATAFLKAEDIYHTVTRQVATFFADFDVLLTPTSTTIPPPVDAALLTREHATVKDLFDHLAPLEAFTALFNGTGQPALSLPLGWTHTGLPIGIQFVSKLSDESTLLKLAAQLEQRLPWSARRPALHASNH